MYLFGNISWVKPEGQSNITKRSYGKKKKKSDWIAAGPNLLDMKGRCKFDSRNSVCKHLSENLFDVGHINEKL